MEEEEVNRVASSGPGALLACTVPTQKTGNLLLKVRTFFKMSGSLFVCWLDFVYDKDVSGRIYIHMTINTSFKEFPVQIFALVSFDLRIRSLRYLKMSWLDI